jgi:hypothetical protein
VFWPSCRLFSYPPAGTEAFLFVLASLIILRKDITKASRVTKNSPNPGGFIFSSKEPLNKFVTSGWEFGGHADAAAKAGETAGELSAEGDIASDIEVYAMTESGLALQATVTGTKYWKDADLN